jgi:hypothetical protein
MILLPDKRTLIITPPKTASRSLGRALCGRGPYEGQLVIGPSMDGRVDHHTAVIPAGKDGYRILASVRHPLDRLVSLWCHLVDEDKRHGRATMAFYVFAAHIGRRDLGTIAGDPFFGWNLCDHLKGLAELRLVKYEQLEGDLAAAELPIPPLPWLGRTSGRDEWPNYYDAATLACVEPWARPDCERFGYEWPAS